GTSAARYRRSAALTRWPPGSMIVRSVWTNASRASASASEQNPRHISSRSGAARSPRRASPRATPSTASRTPAAQRSGRAPPPPGGRRRAEDGRAPPPEPAARDEHEPFAALGELVGELHRDAAAERVPDDARPLVPEGAEEIAHAAGIRAEGVVAPGL